jgi:hypothetical protein
MANKIYEINPPDSSERKIIDESRDNSFLEQKTSSTGRSIFIRRRILGLPPRYIQRTDVKRRVYDKTILSDLPIINITPGVLKYRSQLAVGINKLRNFMASDLLPIEADGRRVYFKYAYPEYARYLNVLAGNLLNKMINIGESQKAFLNIQELLNLGDPELGNDTEFFKDYSNFSGVSISDLTSIAESYEKRANDLINGTQGGSNGQTLSFNGVSGRNSDTSANTNTPTAEELAEAQDKTALETLKTKLGVDSSNTEIDEKNFERAKERPSFRTYGLSFFCDASSVANDSIDNSYGESELERNAKAMADSVKELRFSMANKNIIGKTADIIMQLPEILKSGAGVLTTEGAIGAIMKGAKMTFPKVFDDNSFNRSYSISFKFVSPYGDKFSIFQYVYLPVISLLCFTLPRQLGINSYIAPFLVKIDYPGNFAIDMGVITRMSIDKAGDSNSWSIDGLPLQLNVTIDVMDLFPILMMARNAKLINQSVSMGVYLNNMAGLSLDADNPLHRMLENRVNRFNSMVNNLKYLPDRVKENVSDSFFAGISNMFKN